MEEKKNISEEVRVVARENMASWFSMLAEKDSQKMAGMYSDDTTFLPTLSGDFKRGKEGAEEYFAHFLAKSPEGRVIEEVIAPLGDDAYIHSGMYDFEVDGEGGRETVKARFDYIWRKKSDNKWEIVHHHSSLRPK